MRIQIDDRVHEIHGREITEDEILRLTGRQPGSGRVVLHVRRTIPLGGIVELTPEIGRIRTYPIQHVKVAS